MKLLSVQAENFRSFARLELDLNVDGLVAVVGPNGAGKSTIFSAIEWALYGQRGRGSLPVRRDGAPASADSWVEVEFEVAGRSYRVRRVDGKDAKLSDIASGERLASGRGDTSRQTAVLLGLSRDMFRGTFYARQKEIQALDSDNDARRREQVELLLGIERLRRAAGGAASAAREQERLVEALESGCPDVEALRAELEQAERDAQARAPEVKAAEQRVVEAKQAREQATQTLRRLQEREREHDARAGAHREGKLSADAQTAARDGLREQLAAAEAAVAELETVSPAAALLEQFTQQEREVDRLRGNHERAERLRERQRQALQVAAREADRIAELEATVSTLLTGQDASEPAPATDGDPAEQLAAALETLQAALEHTRVEDGALQERRRQVEIQAGELRELIERVHRAAGLDAELAELAGSETAADAALESWHEARARAAQLQQAIAHDSAHRDAVLAGEAQAACPTCKRPYGEGELDTLAAQFDADLAEARERLAQTKREIEELDTQRNLTERRAKRQRTILAERAALGELPEASAGALEQQLGGYAAQLTSLTAEQRQLEQRRGQLERELPVLRDRLRAIRSELRTISEARASLAHAEREAALFAEELATVPANGYDAAAHAELKRQLAHATAASHRCAALRAKADGVELLRRRVADQDRQAAQALADLEKLAAALAEVALDEQAVPAARAACKQADAAVDRAHEQLMVASRKASADSEAVMAARVRLQEAHRQRAELTERRSELRMRREVADALDAYRESVSRRARPQLEQETALLLSRTTRGRYSTLALSDSYHLEIADGRQLYPLRRFSGGEQDLAALCLRLALSRMLARQRGAETGFVLLDEVFGSQDVDRRRALLEQLHVLADSEFRQVFVISHTDDVVDLCDLSITVARDGDGLSTATGPHR